MEISVGLPVKEGRYIAFVQCDSAQIPDWCEPIIATWHGGKWHCGRPVYGWIGPLPLAKGVDILRKLPDFVKSEPEYDL